MKSIRIGIIGLGKIASDQHLPAIAANPQFTLAATVDRSSPASATNFQSHQAMLQSELELDAVAITTPPGPRYLIARDCIAAGLHLLLEKPPTVTLAQVEALRRDASAGGLTLFTTWHAQHNPAVSAAADLLSGKRVRSMDVVWHEDVEKWHPGQRWIWEAGGFGVFDPGINAFSIVSKIFPGDLLVDTADVIVPEGADTPIAAEIRLASLQAAGTLRCSFDWRSQQEQWTIRATTQEGLEIMLRDGGARLLVDGVEGPIAREGEYPNIYRRFAELIDAGQSQVDVVPLRMVADCLLVGSRKSVPGPPFFAPPDV